jgi:oxygen-dependent protoporphyrinogen oxidase
MAANHTVVLGGGISGLSAAFHLSRRFPRTPLTLLEKSSTVGGWIRSERVKLSSGSSIVLEAGPRTLRPSGKGLMELVTSQNHLDYSIPNRKIDQEP